MDKVINGKLNFQQLEKACKIVPIIVVYDHPTDYPDKFVARVWDCDVPTNLIVVSDSLDKIRKSIPKGLIKCNRRKSDDPCIIETYF